MTSKSATAKAHPNIAFIKYWGNSNSLLRIPANGSISMNLESLFTKTTVIFDDTLLSDEFYLNGVLQSQEDTQRITHFLNHIRNMANISSFASIHSENNFPTAAGIASSASAFAALALAASAALQIELNETALSRLARLGSGSACRSVPSGYVEWQTGSCDEDSFAFSIAPPEHWHLSDCIAVVSSKPKKVGSSEGHELAISSPLQNSRIADAPRRISICRQAILERDFDSLASIIEIDCLWMHAVMMTSIPQLFYWAPATLEIITEVQDWRLHGLPVCYTIDAGANVHVITESAYEKEVTFRLSQIPSVIHVISSQCGRGVELLSKIT